MPSRPRRPPSRFLAPNGRTRTKPLREVPTEGEYTAGQQHAIDQVREEDRLREVELVASHTDPRDEPEQVGPAILEDWEQVRQLHKSQQHAKDVAKALMVRPTLSIDDRVRDIQRRAKQGGYDLRRECALMWRDIERAQAGGRQPPARVYERAEGLESLLDGVTAKAA